MATAECVLYADEVAEEVGEGWLIKVNGLGVGMVRRMRFITSFIESINR